MSVRPPLIAVALLSSLVAACDRGAPEPAQQQGELGETKIDLAGTIDRSHAGELMPAVMISHPDGRTINTAALQGKPVLLNLWATWCAPCIVEMPMLDELAGDYGDSLRVLTVSQDLQGADRVVPFFEENDFANLEPWVDPDNALGFALENQGLPVVALYDASGREVWRVSGGYDWSSAEARGLVEEALD